MSGMTRPLDRRAVLQAGAGAIGAALLAATPMAAGAAPAAAPIPAAGGLSGSLVARIDVVLGSHAEVQFAHLDAASSPTPLGPPRRIAGQMTDACRQAGIEAVGIAARAWGVAPRDCTIAGTRIFHSLSGRSIGYRVWAEMMLPDATARLA